MDTPFNESQQIRIRGDTQFVDIVAPTKLILALLRAGFLCWDTGRHRHGHFQRTHQEPQCDGKLSVLAASRKNHVLENQVIELNCEMAQIQGQQGFNITLQKIPMG